MKVPHYDAKGEANHLFTDSGVSMTFLLTSFYWDNFIYFGMGQKRGADGKPKRSTLRFRVSRSGWRETRDVFRLSKIMLRSCLRRNICKVETL